jgi:hypothetical protein
MDTNNSAVPWYKVSWVWLMLGLLCSSIVLGLSLLAIALKNPPSMVVDNYYDVGKGINTSLEREHYARDLGMQATISIDNDSGVARITLTGDSQPQQIKLNLISPTQPERDRIIILQNLGEGLYSGYAQDSIEGRRIVELLGSDGDGKEWRLLEEHNLSAGQSVQLGAE